ncbi:MAG: RNA polymerase sigma factor [Eubacteriales bacterium]|nr:RNA polymerase sigma factor [Eubacteriales bacterium]
MAKMKEQKTEIEDIYRKYFHDVFLYIRALSGDESVSEEIAQETFLRAMKHIGQFDWKKDVRAWLFVIARNLWYRHCRRNRIYMGEEFLDTMQDPAPPVLEQIVRSETLSRAKYNAELLPEPYREVFRLRIYGELSFEQIGGCYGKSAGWARVTCHRARQMIRKQMSREEAPHGND